MCQFSLSICSYSNWACLDEHKADILWIIYIYFLDQLSEIRKFPMARWRCLMAERLKITALWIQMAECIHNCSSHTSIINTVCKCVSVVVLEAGGHNIFKSCCLSLIVFSETPEIGPNVATEDQSRPGTRPLVYTYKYEGTLLCRACKNLRWKLRLLSVLEGGNYYLMYSLPSSSAL